MKLSTSQYKSVKAKFKDATGSTEKFDDYLSQLGYSKPQTPKQKFLAEIKRIDNA